MPKTKKPTKIEKPVWLKYTKEEIEASLILRDQYGVPKAKIYDIKISKILKQKDKYEEPTNKNLKIKLDKIISHYKKNKQDKTAERSLIITKAKLKKREDYKKKKK
jgi:ribosomal protein S15P/S13E